MKQRWATVCGAAALVGVGAASLVPLLSLASGCGSSGPSGEAGQLPVVSDAAAAPDVRTLGMNDVTILVPLPADVASPVLLRGSDLAADGTPFVPRPLFDRLVEVPPPGGPPPKPGAMPLVPPDEHDRLQLVAVRVDLCDRTKPGECPLDTDGRLRLVFQPLTNDSGAHDVGLHAFYEIPKGDLGTVITRVRELAAIQAEPITSPLRVSPGLTGPRAGDFTTKLRALVADYGGANRLTRLTLNAQPIFFSAIRWAMRGLERRDGAFVAMTIGGGAPETTQDITLFGTASYTATPATDTPVGLFGALSSTTFESTTADRQRAYLEVLAAVDNPLVHGPDTVSCIACHASTVATTARAKTAGVDATTVRGRYTSSVDTSIAAGKSPTTERTVRALGWLGRDAMISQRVANDTAQVLREIEQRFPPQ